MKSGSLEKTGSMKLQTKMLVVVWFLTLAIPMIAAGQGATYVGTEACKVCHTTQYSQLTNSIHQKMIRDASVPGSIHGDLSATNAPADPSAELTYVIGGWYKEESYLKTNALYEFTETQYEWDPIKKLYSNTTSVRNWLVQCAGCHTTGFNTNDQTFAEFNIGCEACHGPGSVHISTLSAADIVIDRSSESCGYCHIRATAATQVNGVTYNFPIGYKLGKPETLQYVPEPYSNPSSFFPDKTSKRHRQQFLDVKNSGHYQVGVTCVSCHDPHTSGTVTTYNDALPPGVFGVEIFNQPSKQYVAWDGDGLVQSKELLCKGCHDAVSEHHKHDFTPAATNAVLTCTDCHMPDVINVDSTTLRGALTPHTFRALGPGNSLKYGPDIMPNSCTYRCHQDKGTNKTERANWAYSVIGDLSYEIFPVCTLTPALDTNTVGTAHTLTATITTNETPVAGVEVSFSVSGAHTIAATNVVTAGDGQATFSYLGANVGTDTITAISSFGVGTTCTATKVWVAPPVPHDLALIKLQAPKTINLKAATPALTKFVKVTLQNRSPHDEVITNFTGLITLVAESLGTNCPNATVVLHPGSPNNPKTLKPKQKMTVTFDVTWDCANDLLKGTGHEDFRYLATVHHEALDGQADTHPACDTCPRPPLPGGVDPNPDPDKPLKDKGCGNKDKATGLLGADVLTDVVVK